MPFWLAVEPTVSTKRPISAGIPSFSLETRNAVGNVAFDDDVPNAVRIASCDVTGIFASGCAGQRPSAGQRVDDEHLQAEPRMTVSTNHQ